MPVLTSGNSTSLTLGAYDSITLQNRAGQSASLTVGGVLVNGAHSGTRTYGPYAAGGAVSITATAGDVYYETADGRGFTKPVEYTEEGPTLTGDAAGAVGRTAGSLNRDVFFGDSRVGEYCSQQIGSPNQNFRYSKGIYGWLMAGLKRYNCLVQNAGVAGDTTTQALARMRNTVRGKGFGVPGVDFTSGAYAPTNPGVAGFNAQNLIVQLGVNDALYGGFTANTFETMTKPNVLAIIKTAFELGFKNVIWLLEPALSAAHAATSAQRALLANLNSYLLSLETVIPNFYAVDIFSLSLDQSVYTNIAGQAVFTRDGLHNNNRGGRTYGAAGLAKLASVLPPTVPLIARNDSQYRGFDSSIKQILQYPCGGAGTGPGGNGWNASGFGGGSAALSMVSQPSGFGRSMKSVFTFTADNSGANVFGGDAKANATEGRYYIATAEIFVTGPSGAELTASDALKEIKLQLQLTTGGVTTYAEDNSLSTGDLPYVGSFSRLLVTPPIRAEGIAAATRFGPNIVATGSAAGSAEVLVQANVWEVEA